MTWDVLFWLMVALFTVGSACVCYQVWKEERAIRAQQRAYDQAQRDAEAAMAKARADRQVRYRQFVSRSVVKDGTAGRGR